MSTFKIVAVILISVAISPMVAMADECEGDTCGSAIPFYIFLNREDDGTFAGDLAPCANDYDPGIPGPSCTRSSAPGKDMVLSVEISCEGFVELFFGATDFDGAIYVVTDCSDVSGSCVAGSDWPGVGVGEYLTFHAHGPSQTLYVIVDAHDAGAGGEFGLTFITHHMEFPSGACCFPDGHCQVLSPFTCAEAGGDYHPCVGCSSNPCPVPINATTWGALKSRYR